MKTTLSLLLISLFCGSLSFASEPFHDFTYVCHAWCTYNDGQIDETRDIATSDQDLETAFKALGLLCDSLDANHRGTLQPISPTNNLTADDFCRGSWH